jgi:hypothetical protein
MFLTDPSATKKKPAAAKAVYVRRFSLFLPLKQSILLSRQHFLTKLTKFSRQCKGTQNGQKLILLLHKTNQNTSKSLLPWLPELFLCAAFHLFFRKQLFLNKIINIFQQSMGTLNVNFTPL